MNTRKQLEAEARELYPDPEEGVSPTHYLIRAGQHQAHVRAKTVTAEQVEAAAETLYEEFRVMDADIQPTWHELPRRRQYLSVMEVKYAFRAAGFYVEGDDVSEAQR